MNNASNKISELLSLGIILSVGCTSFTHAQLITLQDPSAQNTQVAQAAEEDVQEEGAQNSENAEQEQALPQQGTVQQMPARRPVQVSAPALRSDSAMASQPVSIAPGMLPAQSTPVSTQVRRIQTTPVSVSSDSQDADMGSDGLSVSGASTGIGGSNPGNANTGGVQVQHVTVTATQDQKSEIENASDLMRRARQMKEEETNREALDKIEENRYESEEERKLRVQKLFKDQALQNDQASMGLGSLPVETVATVQPVGSEIQAAPMVDAQPSMGVLQTTVVNSNERSENGFRLVPMGGYRWSENNNADYESQNMGMGGVGLEGALTNNLSLEGSFLYGRDEFYYQGAYYNGGYGAGYYNNAYNNGYYNNGYNNGYYANNVLFAPRSRDTFEVTGALKLGARMGSVRPYVLGGLGGMIQKYNIDDSYTTEMLEQIGLSRSTTNFVGNFGGGMDLVASGNLSLGARFDYQSILAKGSYTEMDRIFGDTTSRYRLIGTLQMIF